jgi:hypothetical protein
VNAILQAFRGGAQGVRLVLAATSSDERKQWGKDILDTGSADLQLMFTTLRRNRSRNQWDSSVINFESDRSIQRIEPYRFTWDFIDPWLEEQGWDFGFGGLRNRFQDTLHALFRKVQSRRDVIARKAESLMKEGAKSMSLEDFPDPLIQFKQAFAQLLAPKELLDPEAKKEQLFYSFEGQQFSLDQLSSGEREVVNIVFDFILRNPRHSIIIFDEPELHLHPELSYKLLQTLQTVGENNQFVFCTHSPDIITASLEHSVVFIAPPKGEGQNQAIPVREDDETHQALKLLGQSIGIVALGKRLVLIEGTDSSLDKLTYGAILKNRFPSLVLVPSGGKSVITAFGTVRDSILEKTLWGVEFFMLCDRDAVPSGLAPVQAEADSKGRLRVLKRYHLENYFLQEDVLAACFAEMETEDSWLRDPAKVRAKLKELARPLASFAAALHEAAGARNRVGNVDVMPKGSADKTASEVGELMQTQITAEIARVSTALNQGKVQKGIETQMSRILDSLDKDTDLWKYLVPGKQLLAKFASAAGIDLARLKTMYIRQAEKATESPFKDIIDIFGTFASTDIYQA